MLDMLEHALLVCNTIRYQNAAHSIMVQNPYEEHEIRDTHVAPFLLEARYWGRGAGTLLHWSVVGILALFSTG